MLLATRRLMTLALAMVLVLAGSATAQSVVSLTKSAQPTVLLGAATPVELTANNPASGPYGYNLTFRDVLPPGVHLATSPAPSPAPDTVIARIDGSTVLIWSNVADLAPGSSYAIRYSVVHDTNGTNAFDVPDTYVNTATAYIDTDPRMVPLFSDQGEPLDNPVTGSPTFTDSATASATSRLTAIDITKSESSPERELMRGVHDFQTPYTLTIRNNGVNPTTGIVVDDYLPAALEFLGCGDIDNSAAEEYPGSGSLARTALTPCVTPGLVETVDIDPDGSGPLAPGVYTHVRWTSAEIPGLAAMTPDDTITIRYLAGIPLHANTVNWPGPTPDSAGTQTANLDNNTGPLTLDEQLIRNGATASGTFDRPTETDSLVTDTAVLDRTAEDLRIAKSSPTSTFANGGVLSYGLTMTASEYTSLSDLVVTDTLPNGLCPLDPAVNLENATSQVAECDPAVDPSASPAMYGPSLPYSVATEHADGTWAVTWQGLSLAAGTSTTITFPARVRQYYQDNFNDEASPIASRDDVTNTVTSSATTSIQPDGSPSVTTTDDSSTTHWATGPTIDKRVAAPGPTPAAPTCTTSLAWNDTISDPTAPGDRVCFKLRVDFPGGLFTLGSRVTDFLPPGLVLDPSAPPFATAAHTAGSWTLDTSVANAPSWTLASVSDVGEMFEVIVTAIRVGPDDLASGQVTGNLMKMSFVNTGGTAFPLRDKVDIQNSDAQLSLAKGIAAVTHNGTLTAYSPLADPASPVAGGDSVDYSIDLTNSGLEPITRSEIWDNLPAGITCAMVSAISDGGSCSTAVTPNRITWTNIAVGGAPVAGSTSTTLTYRVTVPGTFAPATSLTNTAGVRQYESTTNTGGTYTYIPTNNIDPTQPTSVPAADVATRGLTTRADDTATITIANTHVTKGRGTSITATGNAAAGQATIGETITYTVDVKIPEGTTVYGGQLLDTIPSSQILLGTPTPEYTYRSTPTGTFDALPAGFTATTTATTLGVEFPASFANPSGSGDDTLQIVYTVRVADIAGNVRGISVSNSATLTQTSPTGTPLTPMSSSISTTVVTPGLTVTKASDFGTAVDAGEFGTYSLTITNPAAANASPVYDVVVTDILPDQLDPVDAANTVTTTGPVPCPTTANPSSGAAAPTCPASPADSAAWDEGTRTLTFGTIAKIDPGSSVTLYYRVRGPYSDIADTAYTNTVSATGTSTPGATTGERTTTVNADNTVHFATGSPLVKTGSPESATVGQEVTFTVDATVPAGVELFDARIVDTLPDGLVFNRYGSITCAAGCGSGLDTAITPFGGSSSGAPTQNADGSTDIGWYLGDISGYLVAGVPTARTYTLTYVANVDDTYDGTGSPVAGTAMAAGTAIVNSVRMGWNITDQQTVKPASPSLADAQATTAAGQATTTVLAPKLVLNKHVSCDGADTSPDDTDSDSCATQPGDGPFTYTITVTNTGTSAAYDTIVSDQPSANLTSVASLTPSDGVVSDGWTAADPDIVWTIAGAIDPGASVTLTYEADWQASADLATASAATNTADVTEYYDVSLADRTGTDAFGDTIGFVRHNDVTADSVTLTIAFPHVSVAKTNDAGDETGTAEVLQPYTWKVVLTNDSSATAYATTVTDTLPEHWSYDTGSAEITVTDPAFSDQVDPSVTGQTLTWETGRAIAPGETMTIVYTATPSLDAVDNTNPNVNTASVQVADATGATANATGNYFSGSDTAEATLKLPSLTIEKSPDCGAAGSGPDCAAPVSAGQTDVPFAITISNSGAVPARNLVITDVMPANLSYVAGSAGALECAPATPCTAADLPFPAAADGTFLDAPGFSETSSSVDATTGTTTVVYALTNLPAGAIVQIRYLADVATPLVNGTVLTNTASVTSDEVTTALSDTGEYTIGSRPYWFGTTAPSYKSAVPDSSTSPTPGDTVTYTVHAVNAGNEVAHDVLITDAIPANTTYVAGSAAAVASGATIEYRVGGSYQSAEPADPAAVEAIRWNVGTLTTSGAGAATETSFAVRINKPLVDGTTITNQATISSKEERLLDIEPATIGEPIAQEPVTHVVDSAPDLELVKSVSDTSLDVVREGQTLDYSLQLTNDGTENATDVVIEDGPPAGTTLRSIDDGGAAVTCSTDPGPGYTFGPCPSDLAIVTMIRWSVSTLLTSETVPAGPVRPSLRVGFGVTVPTPIINGTLIPNSASATSVETASTPTSSNTVTTEIVSGPRLELTKTADTAASVGSGASLTYTLVGRNTGGDAASNAVLEDRIPANTTYVAGSASSGAEFLVAGVYEATEPADPATVLGLRWTDADLVIGEQITGSFTVQVSQTIGRNVNQIRNTATLDGVQRSAGPGGATDPGSLVTNNVPQVTATAANPLQVAKLTIAKRGPARLRGGQTGAWFITVRNVGGVPATNVVITDILPSGFTFVRTGPTPIFANGRAMWTIPVLAPGQSQTRRIWLRADNTIVGARTNVATVRGANVAGAAVRGAARTLVRRGAAARIPSVTG